MQNWYCLFSYFTWIKIPSSFRKNQSKIRFLNWYWYVINGKKRYQKIYHAIYLYFKASKKYLENYHKNKEVGHK